MSLKPKPHDDDEYMTPEQVQAELDEYWYFNHEDPREGGGKYKKRKTNNSKKSRKHSRRQMKSRRYRKSRK